MNDMAMFVMTVNGSIMGAGSPDLDEMRKRAQGHLLSRSRDTTPVELRQLVPGAIGGLGPVLATVRRRKAGGPLVWTQSPAGE